MTDRSRAGSRAHIALAYIAGIAAAALAFCGRVVAAPAEAYSRTALCLYEGPGDLKELKAAFDSAMQKLTDDVKRVQDTANNALEEVRKEGTIHKETNDKLTEVCTNAKAAQDSVKELKDRMTDIEQKLAKRPLGDPQAQKSVGQLFAESEEVKAAVAAGSHIVSPVKIGSIHQKAIVSDAAGTNPQALVAPQRVPGIIMPNLRRLTIRDLLPQMPTDSNVVYFAKENVFTNNAAVVFSSPNDREDIAKPESGITFTSAQAVIETIAHYIRASRQILKDARGLRAYIDARLIYGLKLAEEGELLAGDGSNGHLNGLQTQATTFNRGVSNDTVLDTLLKMILQVSLSYYEADGFVLNPIDWFERVLLQKDTSGRYLFGDPHNITEYRVWGQPVVPTQAQTQGTALTGAFGLGAGIWDNEDATIRTSENVNNDFVKNMIAILAEERMTLTVYRPAAFVKATLPAAGT